MKTILIVEDNKEVRNEISDVFKMENFNVIEANNGLEGYLKGVHNLPDIIISDIMMPVLDGYKMYKEFKKNSMTEQIPIIFLSALSSDDDIRKGMNLGAEDYLTKPINPDDLILATESRLKKYEKIEKRFDTVKTNITNILYHEINTPLNGIIGFSDFLRTQVDELSKDDIKKTANYIYKSGSRLNKLVKKFLIYSELKIKSATISGMKKLRNCEYINTEGIINKIIDNEKFKERRNDFNLSLQAVDLKIEDYLFKLLIEELTDNAVKFSSAGNKIFINSFIDNGSYKIKIKNEGSGITQEQALQINDFNQINTKECVRGSGIGLSIVKLITDVYGNDFEVESIPKTFFSVTVSFSYFMKK